MRLKKLYFIMAIMFTLSLVLAACGDSDESNGGNESDNSGGETPDFLSMLTGGTSGTYYPLGGEMAKIITDETGIQTDAVSSNASADNMIALAEGEAEIAFSQTDVTADAIEGINAFDEAIDNVVAIGSLYPETVQIVTTEKAGIESVEDLAGEKVSVGAPGSGTYINAEQILEVHGMTMDDIDAQNLDFEESTGGIQDGNIAAAFITAGTPTGAVEGLSATEDVQIVPVEEDKAEELVDMYPYYAVDTVEEGTYGVDSDVPTVAVLAMLAITEDIDEDTVYDITKSIYENADSMAHDKAQFIKVENALDGIGIDVHPGAQKYYDEQGVEKND